jgi:hypothetical protein
MCEQSIAVQQGKYVSNYAASTAVGTIVDIIAAAAIKGPVAVYLVIEAAISFGQTLNGLERIDKAASEASKKCDCAMFMAGLL